MYGNLDFFFEVKFEMFVGGFDWDFVEVDFIDYGGYISSWYYKFYSCDEVLYSGLMFYFEGVLGNF